jgi:hypothetical protein
MSSFLERKQPENAGPSPLLASAESANTTAQLRILRSVTTTGQISRRLTEYAPRVLLSGGSDPAPMHRAMLDRSEANRSAKRLHSPRRLESTRSADARMPASKLLAASVAGDASESKDATERDPLSASPDTQETAGSTAAAAAVPAASSNSTDGEQTPADRSKPDDSQTTGTTDDDQVTGDDVEDGEDESEELDEELDEDESEDEEEDAIEITDARWEDILFDPFEEPDSPHNIILGTLHEIKETGRQATIPTDTHNLVHAMIELL